MEIKRLRCLALEIFKTLNNLNPYYMKGIFSKTTNLTHRHLHINFNQNNTTNFFCFASENFESWKKHVIPTSLCLSLLFKRRCDCLKGEKCGQGGVCNRKGYLEFIKIFIWKGVLKMEMGEIAAIFPKIWYCPPCS